MTFNDKLEYKLENNNEHIRIKEKKEADKAAKQAIIMPGMTTRRLQTYKLTQTYTNYRESCKLQMSKGEGKQY